MSDAELNDSDLFETPAAQSFRIRKAEADKQLRQRRLKNGPGHKRSLEPVKTEKVKKPHRFRPGTVAKREIKKLQKKEDFFIPKLPFRRLVAEIVQSINAEKKDPQPLRISANALEALQIFFESETVEVCKALQAISEFSGVKTVMPAHFEMLKFLFSTFDLRAICVGDPLPRASFDELKVALHKLGSSVDEAKAKFGKDSNTVYDAVGKMIHFKCYDMDERDLAKATALLLGPNLRQQAWEYLTTRQTRAETCKTKKS